MSSKVLVGSHGAGLANIEMLAPGTGALLEVPPATLACACPGLRHDGGSMPAAWHDVTACSVPGNACRPVPMPVGCSDSALTVPCKKQSSSACSCCQWGRLGTGTTSACRWRAASATAPHSPPSTPSTPGRSRRNSPRCWTSCMPRTSWQPRASNSESTMRCAFAVSVGSDLLWGTSS